MYSGKRVIYTVKNKRRRHRLLLFARCVIAAALCGVIAIGLLSAWSSHQNIIEISSAKHALH